MLSPVKFLQRLEPTRRILGVVNASRGGGVGLSLSDPYLSFSKPLLRTKLGMGVSNDTVEFLRRVMEENDCGGILIGRQMRALMTVQCVEELKEADVLQELLIESLVNEADLIQQYPCTVSSLDCDEVHYEKEVEQNLLWEGLKEGDSDESCDHSALCMQMWLDEHCGGWANTFG
jgi:hypothetical protein